MDDVWGLDLVSAWLTSLIQGSVRLLWRTYDALRVVLVLLVVRLVSTLNLLVPNEDRLSKVVLLLLTHVILVIGVVIAALSIDVVHVLRLH